MSSSVQITSNIIVNFVREKIQYSALILLSYT